MQCVTILIYVALDGEVSPSRIFTVMQLFQLLQQPLQGIPSGLQALANLQVANSRIGAFLKLAEIEVDKDDIITNEPVFSPPGEEEPAVLEIIKGSYAWAPPMIEPWEAELPKNRVELAEQAKLEAKQKEEAAAAAANMKNETTSEDVKNASASSKDVELSVTGEDKSEENGFKLEGIDLSLKKGTLVGVVGSVGSGKSSLLSAIMNEMHKVEGKLVTRGRIAYAAQQAWIQNNTLRGNVLFDMPYDPEWYKECLKASALMDDIKMMTDGDMTEIGERGINLSGGQKARVGLCRALYAQADIALLDDPLAAVDTHVADHIFQESILGVLKKAGTTTLLVTNQLHRLPSCDLVVWIEDGKIKETGTFAQLEASGLDFADLMDRQGVQANEQEAKVDDETTKTGTSLERATSDASEPHSTTSTGRDRVASTPMGDKKGKTLLDEEERESGKVEWEVYEWYAGHVGAPLMTCLVLFTTCQVHTPRIFSICPQPHPNLTLILATRCTFLCLAFSLSLNGRTRLQMTHCLTITSTM